ncbi:hypothetical protein ES703_115590 [subsurface metagenome]
MLLFAIVQSEVKSTEPSAFKTLSNSSKVKTLEEAVLSQSVPSPIKKYSLVAVLLVPKSIPKMVSKSLSVADQSNSLPSQVKLVPAIWEPLC